MAWLMQTKVLPRWTIGTRTEPPAAEVHKTRLAYHFAHPELTPDNRYVWKQGVRMPAELFPRKAYILSSTRNPPDFLTIQGWGFSERVRQIVEAHDPGRHQMVGVQTFLRDGTPTPQPYFAFCTGNVARNQVVAELTTAERSKEGWLLEPRRDDHNLITINRVESATWHLWMSREIGDALTISDELRQAFEKAGVKGLDYTQVAELM